MTATDVTIGLGLFSCCFVLFHLLFHIHSRVQELSGYVTAMVMKTPSEHTAPFTHGKKQQQQPKTNINFCSSPLIMSFLNFDLC